MIGVRPAVHNPVCKKGGMFSLGIFSLFSRLLLLHHTICMWTAEQYYTQSSPALRHFSAALAARFSAYDIGHMNRQHRPYVDNLCAFLALQLLEAWPITNRLLVF